MDKRIASKNVKRFVLPEMEATEVECFGGCIVISQHERSGNMEVIAIPLEYLSIFTDAINTAKAEAGVI